MPRHRRTWYLESLESRRLLSATTSPSNAPSPEWFGMMPAETSVSSFATVPQSPTETLIWDGISVEAQRGEWLMQFRPEYITGMTGPADAAGYLAGAPFDLQVVGGLGLPGMIQVKVSASPDEAAAWFGKLGTLDYFEPNTVQHTRQVPTNLDPGLEFQYSLNNDGSFPQSEEDADIDAFEAWDITTGSSDVIVAVIDSGVDHRHEDLKDNMWRNPGEIPGNSIDDDRNGLVDDVFGFDFGTNDPDPMDFSDHGTSVAGVIGAQGDNETGVVGVNWEVSIMAVKIEDATGSLNDAATVRALNYVTMMRNRGHNVQISNNSYGGYFLNVSEQRAIEAHQDAGILFVAAAGNDGNNNDRIPSYPDSLRFDNVISVAATGPADELADFSNIGFRSVDIGAPGVQILTTQPRNSYEFVDGTSFSSPMTAGVAALVSAYAPTANYKEIRQAIIEGVDKIPSLVGKVATQGRLNAFNALKAIERIKPAVAEVAGNGLAIPSGDTTPNTADGTDFGSVNVTNGSVTRTFSLANIGGVPLELASVPGITISGANAADFSVTNLAAPKVVGGTSTEFALRFDPTAAGIRTALVTLTFKTGTAYTFTVTGNGVAPTPPWQNPRDRFDVNNDGHVAGLDVLLLINELNRSGPRQLPPVGPGSSPPPYYDVSGDGNLTALDVVQVINRINTGAQLQAAPMVSNTVDTTTGDLPGSSVAATTNAADVLFSTAWEKAADDLATSLGKPARANRRL